MAKVQEWRRQRQEGGKVTINDDQLKKRQKDGWEGIARERMEGWVSCVGCRSGCRNTANDERSRQQPAMWKMDGRLYEAASSMLECCRAAVRLCVV